MSIASGSAAAKVILFGEHAVVYGRPAIAAPLSHLRARASIKSASLGEGCIVLAADLGQEVVVAEAASDDPLALIVRNTLDRLSISSAPDWIITIQSDIPIASGLGSGAAVSAAVVRAIAARVGSPLDAADISDLVYEAERLHHGTPSGIDNTVVAYEQPIYYMQGQRPEPLHVGVDLTLVIADTGIPSPTKAVVADVRKAWEAEPSRLEALFDDIGRVVDRARAALQTGPAEAVGRLMDDNQRLLVELRVSSPVLTRLCDAARRAGAYGAKLSGAGRGGNVVAVVPEGAANEVALALRDAGARATYVSHLRQSPP